MGDEDKVACNVNGTPRRADIIDRLYTALDRKMGEIETRIARASRDEDDTMSAADCERDARTLTALARLYEKICELEGAASMKSHEGELAQEAQEIDADRFRQGIAERLERMLKAGED